MLSLLFLVAGCGTSAAASRSPISDTARHHRTAPRIVRVRIVPDVRSDFPDSFYVPRTIHLHVGQIVVWTNTDTDLHDVAAYTGIFASPVLGARGTYRWKALRPGRYAYFCTLHPEMHGTIVVTA